MLVSKYVIASMGQNTGNTKQTENGISRAHGHFLDVPTASGHHADARSGRRIGAGLSGHAAVETQACREWVQWI